MNRKSKNLFIDPIIINPTLACADRLNLKADLDALKEVGNKLLHLDIMDGHYVPNLCFDLTTIKQIRAEYDFLLDVHLMVTNPQDYLIPLKEAGADYISFHMDTYACAIRLLEQIRTLDMKGGIAINPSMPSEYLKEILPYVDYVLVMGVEPGFSGQAFLKGTVRKIDELLRMREERSLSYLIEVDGGVNDENTRDCILAGTDILISGAFGVFRKRLGLAEDYLEYKKTVEQFVRIRKGEKNESDTGFN